VDDNPALRGEPGRELLEACGAVRYICPVLAHSSLTSDQKYRLRLTEGHVSATYDHEPQDYGLRGLGELLAQLPTLSIEGRRAKARLLWESLAELQDRRGEGVFSGTYRWQYHQMWSATFDAQFIRTLNEASWIPDAEGDLVPPSIILFENTGWSANPFLQSKILFKKPIVEELAKEAGFEPGMLDMLKKLGVTSTADLMARLKVENVPTEQPAKQHETNLHTDSAETGQTRDSRGEPVVAPDGEVQEGAASEDEVAQGSDADNDGTGVRAEPLNGNSRGSSAGSESSSGSRSSTSNDSASENGSSSTASRKRARTFVSYVAMYPEDEDDGDDRDGLDHQARLALEAKAIELICSREPLLRPMPAGNEGFDLIEPDANNDPQRWIEVKAMKGSLEDRPVGLSSVQFDFARRHNEQFWLYIVEHADDAQRARIVRINDPVAKAGTFTFDKGWTSVAEIDALSSPDS
jgi:hypothetical protein